MIAQLRGTVADIADQSIVLHVESLSFELFIPNPSTVSLNKKIELYTHLHWNAEQGPTLFGFHTRDEKMLFLLLTKCPGIGPKIALAILSHLSPETLIPTINQADIDSLSSVPGIGKKKAEQLIVQLKGPISKLLEKGEYKGENTQFAQWKEIADVLGSLNYSRTEINTALSQLQESAENQPFDQLLRKALAHLNKRP